jgi:hypothetical protein
MRALGYAADADPRALADAGAEVFDSMRELGERLGLARRGRRRESRGHSSGVV